jgi:hypothetical protein
MTEPSPVPGMIPGMDLDLDLTVVLIDQISGSAWHPYPTAEWVGYSHSTMLDYARKVHRENAIGGALRHAGSREAGRVTVTDAAGQVLIDYQWMTLTSEELEAAQE